MRLATSGVPLAAASSAVVGQGSPQTDGTTPTVAPSQACMTTSCATLCSTTMRAREDSDMVGLGVPIRTSGGGSASRS